MPKPTAPDFPAAESLLQGEVSSPDDRAIRRPSHLFLCCSSVYPSHRQSATQGVSSRPSRLLPESPDSARLSRPPRFPRRIGPTSGAWSLLNRCPLRCRPGSIGDPEESPRHARWNSLRRRPLVHALARAGNTHSFAPARIGIALAGTDIDARRRRLVFAGTCPLRGALRIVTRARRRRRRWDGVAQTFAWRRRRRRWDGVAQAFARWRRRRRRNGVAQTFAGRRRWRRRNGVAQTFAGRRRRRVDFARAIRRGLVAGGLRRRIGLARAGHRLSGTTRMVEFACALGSVKLALTRADIAIA